MIVYTDGACFNNGFKNAKAGYGIYFGENDPRNVSARVPDDLPQTNNVGELLAIIEAIKISNQSGITIYTDSEYCIKMANKLVFDPKAKNMELVKELSRLKHQFNVILRHIRSHTNNNDEHSIGNDNADRLANLSINLDECPYQTPVSVFFASKKIEKQPKRKIYIKVSYDEKDNAKKLGAKWDPKKKCWYGFENDDATDLLFAKYQKIL